jgi:predicted nucleic acid-binding protein
LITPAALLDSNVIVACLAQAHEQHTASAALVNQCDAGTFAVAAHSFAEAYATLTRNIPFGFTADEARAGLESVRAFTDLVGLTPSQTFDTVRRYAAAGGIGARLYDALIGQVAVAHGIPAIVTWNTRHVAGLFSNLTVVTPVRYAARGSRRTRT